MESKTLTRIDEVEIHIKRDLKAHLCHPDAADCAWHCPNHMHADADSKDATRATACSHEHSVGCAECAKLDALTTPEAIEKFKELYVKCVVRDTPDAGRTDLGNCLDFEGCTFLGDCDAHGPTPLADACPRAARPALASPALVES